MKIVNCKRQIAWRVQPRHAQFAIYILQFAFCNSLLAFSSSSAAASDDLSRARHLLLSGKYAEAADIYAPLAKKQPAAAIGLARCHESRGNVKEARAALAPLAAGRADVQAELARLALAAGDVKEAAQAGHEALRLDRHQLLAQWILAEVDRTAGRLSEARRGYHQLIDYYNDADVKDPETLRWIGLAAGQYARWNHLSDQFHFLVNDLYPDALELDHTYWPAHYEAGVLFAEKYNRADAEKEFNAALELNPQAAEVWAALADLALENRDVSKAQRALRRALEINSHLLAARRVEADLAWLSLDTTEALRLLEENARPLCPVDEETLGRIAACYVVLDGAAEKKNSRFTRLVDEVTARNPHAGQFYWTLAEMLDVRNKRAESQRYYREAMRVMPQLSGPLADLGLSCMRMAEEDEARKLLHDAFEADPFHVRVKNMMEVLDILRDMKTMETAHLVIKYDERDAILTPLFKRHLDDVYAELCRRFDYTPPKKVLLEVFTEAQGQDGHQWFSARMVGLPYLDTVSACTGPLVALTSPNDPHIAKHFNWLRVLRHELVHVITLQQTNYNIPHWYTEGLAVWSEGYPRPTQWNELLARRVPRGKVFDLQSLDMAFARPEVAEDWQMAYCQANLYVEYIVSRGGEPALRKMLAAYREGCSTAKALRRALDVSVAEFERGYCERLKQTAAEVSVMQLPAGGDLPELQAACRQHPQDARAAAELAYAYLERDATARAREAAEKALKLQPREQLAAYVLARLQADAGKRAAAVKMLEDCLDRRRPDPLALNLLAGLKLKAEKYDEAIELYTRAEKLDPRNTKWTSALARVYLLSGRKMPLQEALTRLVRADSEDCPARKKLAELCLSRRDYRAAARWAGQALEIDVADADAHRLLAEALVGRERHAAAIEEFEVAIQLNPKSPQPRFALADACVQAGQKVKARKVLQELLKLAPDYPGAEVLLESLDKGQ
jgi:cellulose synthase operon protein C